MHGGRTNVSALVHHLASNWVTKGGGRKGRSARVRNVCKPSYFCANDKDEEIPRLSNY